MTNQDEVKDKVRRLGEIIDATRTLFHRMAAVAAEVHKEVGVTGGLRGVLQELYQHGPRSVPEMARARPVSRQHIQTLVNELLRRSEVELIHNPAHARSKLVRLTDRGRDAFEAIRRREVALLARLPLEARTDALAETAKVLRSLKDAFEDPEWLMLVETDRRVQRRTK